MRALQYISFFTIIFLFYSCGSYKPKPPKKDPVPMTAIENRLISEGIQFKDNSRLHSAKNKFIEVLKINSDNVVALYELAEVYRLLGDCESSLDLSLDGLRYKSDLYSRLAISASACLADKSEFETAKQVLNLALDSFPDVADLYLNRSAIYKYQQEYDSARFDMETYVSMNPLDPFGHTKLGDFYKYQMKFDEALLIYYVFILLDTEENLSNKVFYDIKFFVDAKLMKMQDNEIDFKERFLNPSIKKIKNIDSLQKTIPPVYYSFYKELEKKQFTEEFIYYVFSSSSFNGIQDWIAENQTDMKKFYEWVDAYEFKAKG